MDIRLLKHYVAAVEHGNMLKAARAIHVTQPAITKSIKTLENELDVRLLDRLPTGVAPTRFGRRLYEHATLILNQIDRAEAEIKGGTNAQWSRIRIGYGLNFAGSILVEAVFDVLESRPSASATITSKSFDELVSLLSQGDLDLAVAVFPFNEPHPDLTYEVLVEDEFRAVCRKDHPLVGRGQLSLKTLADQPWVLFDRTELLIAVFNSVFLDKDLLVPRPTVQTNSVYVLKSALRNSNRIAYLPTSIVFEELKRGELVILLTEMPRKKTQAGIIYRANDIVPDAVMEIVETLRNSREKLQLLGPRGSVRED